MNHIDKMDRQNRLHDCDNNENGHCVYREMSVINIDIRCANPPIMRKVRQIKVEYNTTEIC